MTVGERIKIAREAQAAEIKELADVLELPTRIIDAWENNGRDPSEEELAMLAEALSVHPYYLVQDDIPPELAPMSHHFLTLDDDVKSMVHGQGRMALDRLVNIERLLDPSVIPQGVFPAGFPVAFETLNDVAHASADVRAAWQLDPLTPIPHLIDLLDSVGLRVVTVPDVPRPFDACLFFNEESGVPVIVANAEIPGDDQRFGIARELGTLLLRDSEAKQAAFFALTFIAPPRAVRAQTGPQLDEISLESLHTLKHQFGLSMHILGPYLFQLGVIPQPYLQVLLQQFESEAFADGEPGTPYPVEEMSRLKQMVFYLYQNKDYDTAHAAALLGIEDEEWEQLVS